MKREQETARNTIAIRMEDVDKITFVMEPRKPKKVPTKVEDRFKRKKYS